MSNVARGVLDTSVLVDVGDVPAESLPVEIYVPAVALAELAAGPHAARSKAEAARRQVRLQAIEASFSPLPFDAAAARAYGMIYAAARTSGRKTKRRLADYMIAATALANGLPLYTKNPKDFAVAKGLVEIVAVPARH
jgi:predicted nucleic acid-binding protein